ncbi:trypsin alpha-3-like [Drosophila ficusphila]|uniref:trypsin alpha-3-like n=1 Tax=Drosophila ficusphila TaxID=30025 RepID=UPI001C898A59|nr:trypsin alpha-3-like [Drosophila ficusphila]
MFMQWTLVIFSVTLISAGSISERIEGGSRAEISKFPWQASLHIYGLLTCGAVIYSNEIVITAAQYVLPEFPKIHSVRVGSSIDNTGGQEVQVAQIISHENFKLKGVFAPNNIAVIRLQSKLILGNSVSPIPLADKAPSSGSLAWVSGYGRPEPDELKSQNLFYSALKIVNFDECQNLYKYLSEDMICAGAPGHSVYEKDVGDPLVSDGKLVGIVSFVSKWGLSKYPVVYANVAELKPWILNAIAKL